MSPNVIDLSCAAKKLRTLLLCDCSSIIIKDVNWDMILQLSHIRVLDLNGSDISVLPSAICRLKHLKFLELSGTGIKTMPDSITSLYSLQTLTLNNCVKLQELPLTIGKLQNLRSLDLSHTNIQSFPESIIGFQNLQTLKLSKCSKLQELPLTIDKLQNLRSLDLSHTNIHSFPKSIDGLHSLQTLDLSNCSKLQELPLAIGKLQNLRLLDLSHSNIQALPESISHLPNLQILNLSECSELRELPEGIQNMISLNHLDISGCELTCMPHGLGKLHSLQMLPLFVVGTEPGRTIMQLQDLNHIRGVLRITCLSNVKDSEEAKGADLGAKAGLHSLELWWRKEWTRQWGEVVMNWEAFSPPSRENTDVALLENLKPHPNLRHLTIEDYGGNRFPSWLTGMDIPNLESFSLYNLERCKSLPPLGRFLSLKHLKMESMYALQRINSMGGTFLSLKYLELWNLPCLEEWFMPEGEMFHSLESLIIVGCPKLKIKSQLPSSLVELELGSVNQEVLAGGCLYGLSRLRKLKIAHFEASESGWQGLQYLTALENLEIMNCYLTGLPDCIMQQHFPSLWTLKLTLNSDLETLGEGKGGEPPLFFSELRHLNIQGCDELTALPEWLGLLTFLQSLELSYCDNLEVVPDELRKRLPQLTIRGCPKLE